ncbi:cupredoxin domain-containing protein [Candidatus Uhrbacteria bacterium]|nr:cupredoxin domain-containing protein [Candidatus Uhrbacteria bacterium]
MKKLILIAILITVGSMSGIVYLLRSGGQGSSAETNVQSNVSIKNGKQIIEIVAKGGYTPRNTIAKANVPTTLIIKTKGTYDCSSAISIPVLKYNANLPPTGSTPIEIPPQSKGTIIKGLCTMGMYNFTISFTE